MSGPDAGGPFVLSSRQLVAAKPQMAFKLISDLPGYGAWSPSLTTAPAAKTGEAGQLDFRIRVGKISTAFVMAGQVVASDPPHAFSWRMGGFGIQLLETFEIIPMRGGTQITHTVKCEGRFKGLIGKGLLRTYGGVMHALDAAIAGQLAMPKIRR